MFLELLKFGRICGVRDSNNQDENTKHFGRFFLHYIFVIITRAPDSPESLPKNDRKIVAYQLV